jgi:hypothetical protein
MSKLSVSVVVTQEIFYEENYRVRAPRNLKHRWQHVVFYLQRLETIKKNELSWPMMIIG